MPNHYICIGGNMQINSVDKLDLVIYTNNSYSIIFYFDVDISSYTFTADLANKTTGTKIVSFTVSKSTTPTTIKGLSMLGSVTLSLTENQIETNLVTTGKYAYDLKMSSGGNDILLLQGDVIVNRGFTE